MAHSEEDLDLQPDDQYDGIDKGQDYKEDFNPLTILIRLIENIAELDKSKIKWGSVVSLFISTILAFIGGFLMITFESCWQTLVFTFLYTICAGLGITMGAHRYWSHRSFKAAWPVQLVLMLMNCIAFQESIFTWSHKHRVHHKWSDTDRDFTNSRRGGFFAHVGWKMYEEHCEVSVGRKLICVKDLCADPVVVFQHTYYYLLSVPMAFIIPAVIPWLFWGEILEYAIYVTFFRLFVTFNLTWCVNSIGHMYGDRPHDVTSYTFDNSVFSQFVLGEGQLNFHHSYPCDYRGSEDNNHLIGNFTTTIIDLLAVLHLVWDRKRVSREQIMARRRRTGDLGNTVPRY